MVATSGGPKGPAGRAAHVGSTGATLPFGARWLRRESRYGHGPGARRDGGLLSHGSIVAREYGVPAVVGVAGATKTIRTGDRIRLDGARGQVFKLGEEGQP
ncbi:MAG: hypothetical protein JRJ64_14195 [Deltaproteobacteria bacterium]|nr:hypothetical protein [Deltaproteobacteria bacterium]